MAVIQDPNSSIILGVEGAQRAARIVMTPRGDMFAMGHQTGTIAAALAQNSSVFAMRLDPSASKKVYIERIRCMWTTVVAFTTPLTAGRRLALFRGAGASPTGGTQITDISKKDTTGPDSECIASTGGESRIATTGALGITGITFETNPIRIMTLADVGAAGDFKDWVWEFSASECAPIVLAPGEVLAIRNPAAMDAAGTWQLGLNIDWYEMAAPS